MTRQIKFSSARPAGDRIHYVTEEDITVVLNRLPEELWQRLRQIHFNDQSQGIRRLGYVNQGRKEITLCALPPRISLTRFLVNGQSPTAYGAKRGSQWPTLAVRRFLLYDTFMHQLGHLQVILEDNKSVRRKFAMDTLAHEFAVKWRKTLWATHFFHSDPVHNRPTEAEFDV